MAHVPGARKSAIKSLLRGGVPELALKELGKVSAWSLVKGKGIRGTRLRAS